MERIQDRILKAIKEIDRPITPLELAKIIGANPESVRTRLSKMLKAGLIIRPFPRHYKPIPIYGVGSPPRLQNLLVVADKVKNPELKGLVTSHVIEKEFPSIPDETFRVRLVFGSKRDKIHWTVKAPMGLDYYGLLMTRAWVESEVSALLDLIDLNWMVKRYEILWDHLGIKLEGVSVVTIDDLEGTMEKYYNKFYSVRKEVRQSPESQKLENLVALASGGLPQYQMTSSLALLVNQVENMNRSIGLFLQDVQSDRRLVKAVMDAQIRVSDILDRVTKRIEKLEKD